MSDYHERQEQDSITETEVKNKSREHEKHDELFKLLLENFFLEFTSSTQQRSG